MWKISVPLIVAVLSVAAQALEGGSSLTNAQLSNIHVPPGFRRDHPGELIRQLNVPAFADLGRDWYDAEAGGTLHCNNPTFPRFSFKQGTIAQALDQYCKSLPFQWHEWKEAGAIWLEPKAVEHRSAALWLERPFTSIPALPEGRQVIHQPGKLEPGLRYMWRKCAELPAEEALSLDCPDGLDAFANERDLSYDFLFANRSLPTNMLETVRLWLKQAPHCVAALSERESGEVAPRLVKLSLGSTCLGLSELPVEDVLKGLASDSPKPAGFASHYDRRYVCERELYRRMVSDRESTVAKCLKEGTIEKEILLEGSCAFGTALVDDLMCLDQEVFSDLIVAVFKAAPKEAQHKMLEHGVLCGKLSHCPKTLWNFYEELSHSDDPALSKEGKELMEQRFDQ